MRYCGIDVSGGRRGQHLCTLEERGGELVPTFYAPGTVEAVARTVLGFGDEAVVAIDAPSGPRRDLLAPGRPLRAALSLADGRYERFRVCDALLTRRGLPLYQVPAEGEPVATWMACGFGLFEALRGSLGLYRPAPNDARLGPVGAGALRHGRLAETYPDAAFCALLGHRPSPKQTPGGGRARIEALEERGVAGDLWQRSLDELDACVAAYAAYALAGDRGCWVGDPDEGVIVLPVEELKPKYARLERPDPAPLG